MTRALRWADGASLEPVSSTWIAKPLSSSPNTSSRWVLALLVVSTARAQEIPGSFETTVRSERRVAPGQVTLRREALDEQGAQSAADALQWDAAFTAPAGARGEHIFTLRGFDQRQPDIAKAKSIIEWAPKVGLEDGLKETIAYFRRKLTA